jgi:CubicO group peptidase (beta-lactamase class C family)
MNMGEGDGRQISALRRHPYVRASVNLFLLLTFLLTACSTVKTTPYPSQSPSLASQVDTFLTGEVENEQFSGSVLIARAGKVLFSKGYGMADWDHHVPNAPQTEFRIGSLTKQFTAMAILLLQERGKLHVQDHICLYVPHCPTAWQPITIQHLLTHTSGIPNFTAFSDFDFTQSYSPEQLIAHFIDKPLAFQPGTRYSYSNSGYVVLGYIIERVTGEPYALFLQHAIFTPLQMRNTGYDQNYPPLPEHATGYQDWQFVALAEPVKAQYIDMSVLFAAGGLYSTVEDLYRWTQALSTPVLVSQKSLDAMFTPHISICSSAGCPGHSFVSAAGYGYGWVIAKEQGPYRQVIWHNGAVPGFKAYLGLYPATKTTIIVLSNLASTDELAIAADLELIVFKQA